MNSLNILLYPLILMIWETSYHIFNCFREPIGRTSRRVLSSSGVHFGTLFIIDLAPRSKYVIICKNINCPSGRILLIHLCRTNTPIRNSWWGNIFSVGARSWLVLNVIETFQEIINLSTGNFLALCHLFLAQKGGPGTHLLLGLTPTRVDSPQKGPFPCFKLTLKKTRLTVGAVLFRLLGGCGIFAITNLRLTIDFQLCCFFALAPNTA